MIGRKPSGEVASVEMDQGAHRANALLAGFTPGEIRAFTIHLFSNAGASRTTIAEAMRCTTRQLLRDSARPTPDLGNALRAD